MKYKYDFGFIGTGAYGSALANVLSYNNKKISMYGIDEKEIQDINDGHNQKYFGSNNFFNKENIFATNDLSEVVLNSNFIILAIPSNAIKSVLKQISGLIKFKKINLINLSKGIEPSTELFFSQFIKRKFNKNLKNLATLLGPSFAIEIFNKELTVINIVGENKEYNEKLIQNFNNNYFKLVENSNEIGLELFASLKNVLAIGLGIASIATESKNTNAALITIGIQEMITIYRKLTNNVDNDFVYQFAGIGDTFLTCTSVKSRNYTFGTMIGEFGINVALEKTNGTVEGYTTAKSLEKIIKNNQINVPFFENIIEILSNKKEHMKICDFITKNS
ncbi:NAD(P)H-dependent glycerol-3-phosphate dehydrogenase [Mycoplasma sp. CSL7503-lung]|uniref:NAD(P)H-dependent glycerol-3-phosphate dehydrogenase n=1 Tax=Mycoplasma sp. CSL7503-lung TaxID=536372 RepID=UPI0021D08F3E|nr:NAD(P)H-dependent glycerol-3-phosphate dehydrogenase [Mycoplasma sp. CSL7503-lung]MCU4706676.1 NAD(P)-binding domain-containing protein [Mycoplasma sp. CSL7503-lung]